ncbi:hypothetical protein J6590_025237 [Homalodisca vitripennis]|nr:hypothetical protein J6590_025237 [Homalodisca vitripennis]
MRLCPCREMLGQIEGEGFNTNCPTLLKRDVTHPHVDLQLYNLLHLVNTLTAADATCYYSGCPKVGIRHVLEYRC